MLSNHGAVLRGIAWLIVILACLPGVAGAQDITPGPFDSRSATIAIVTDGHSPGDTVADLIEDELRRLVAERPVALTFKRDPGFDGRWDAAAVSAELSRTHPRFDGTDLASVGSGGRLLAAASRTPTLAAGDA